MNELLENQQAIAFATPVICAAIFYLLGFGTWAVIGVLSAYLAGYQLAAWVWNDAEGHFMTSLIKSFFNHTATAKPNINTQSPNNRRNPPWEDLTLPSSLNEALESLLDQLVDQYVNDWYESGISHDRAFLDEIRYQVRYACATVFRLLRDVDVSDIVSSDFIPLIGLHVHRVLKHSRSFEDRIPLSLAENRIVEQMYDLHYCVGSRQNEIKYLRQIADWIVPQIVDVSRLSGRSPDDEELYAGHFSQRPWPSHPARHFLRELVVNAFLLPLLDLLADPDTVNRLLILSFNNNLDESSVIGSSTSVPFLHGLTEDSSSSVPDSLLQLKLSEILRDPRQFSMFRLYLKDVRGPVNELTFLAEATRIHHSLQRMDETEAQILYDVWQLFGQFIHDYAPERIPFDSKLIEEFSNAIEKKDFAQLDTVFEKAYLQVYRRVQSEYVVSFCQSDSFLGHLCGSPPVSLTELISKPELPRRNSATAPTLSLNTFRTNLRRLLIGGSEDSEDEDMALKDDKSIPMDVYRTSRESSASVSPAPSGSIPSINVNEGESEIEKMEEVVPEPAPSLVVDKDSHNINNWKIVITDVVPIDDEVTGRTSFGYLIDVVRSDSKPHETKNWSIIRRFPEFYVLEAKLSEFHGDSLRIAVLPPRKAFAPRTRVFVEQNRGALSSFISSLCKQRALNRSDLLFAFLTSREEFRDNIVLRDLNPWKVVKKVPGKLTRERGQHLRPFLLNMMATTLAPPNPSTRSNTEPHLSDSSSSSSFGANMTDENQYLYSPVFGNNCIGCKVSEYSDIKEKPWTRSSADSLILLTYSLFSPLSEWFFNLLASLKHLCGCTVDCVVSIFTKKIIDKFGDEAMMVSLVHLIQQSLFCSEANLPTGQEKSLREELARRKLLDSIQDEVPSFLARIVGRRQLRDGAQRIVQVLQYPRLNKQLSYVLLDSLLEKLFPTEIMPPLVL